MQCRAPKAQGPARSEHPLPVDAEVQAPGIERLGEPEPARNQATGDGAAFAVLQRGARGEQQRRPGVVRPEEPRPDNQPAIPGQVGPPIAIEILPLLAVAAGEQAVRPSRIGSQRTRRKPDQVGRVAIVLGQEELVAASRRAREEVHHAAERLPAVERGRGAADDLDSSEIERRNLDQAQLARFASI